MFSPGEGSCPPRPLRVRGKQGQEAPEEGPPRPTMLQRVWSCCLPGRTRQEKQTLPLSQDPQARTQKSPNPPPPANTAKAVSQDFQEQLAPKPRSQTLRGLPRRGCHPQPAWSSKQRAGRQRRPGTGASDPRVGPGAPDPDLPQGPAFRAGWHGG